MRFRGAVFMIVCVICSVKSKSLNPESSSTRKHHVKRHGISISRRDEDFDVVTETGDSHPTASPEAHESTTRSSFTENRESHHHARQGKMIDQVRKRPKSFGKGKRKKHGKTSESEDEERGWHYCSDGVKPKHVKDLNETMRSGMGFMCGDMYPDATCCYNHDLNMELVGDKILEQVSNHECARMLMKLRCAHCSPRSWWLFHAPDMRRLPHKRVLPIMCPSFCRRFHRVCRDSVGGIQDNDFCDFHTTDEEGPCFPDSAVRRGTID